MYSFTIEIFRTFREDSHGHLRNAAVNAGVFVGNFLSSTIGFGPHQSMVARYNAEACDHRNKLLADEFGSILFELRVPRFYPTMKMCHVNTHSHRRFPQKTWHSSLQSVQNKPAHTLTTLCGTGIRIFRHSQLERSFRIVVVCTV